jgi:hypothetical protein
MHPNTSPEKRKIRTSRKCLRLQFPQACVVAPRHHQLFVCASLYDSRVIHVPESELINTISYLAAAKVHTL